MGGVRRRSERESARNPRKLFVPGTISDKNWVDDPMPAGDSLFSLSCDNRTVPRVAEHDKKKKARTNKKDSSKVVGLELAQKPNKGKNEEQDKDDMSSDATVPYTGTMSETDDDATVPCTGTMSETDDEVQETKMVKEVESDDDDDDYMSFKI